MLFTDGVSESMNIRDEEWGEDEVDRIRQNLSWASGHGGMKQIFTAAQAFAAGAPQHDDMTLVVLRIA